MKMFLLISLLAVGLQNSPPKAKEQQTPPSHEKTSTKEPPKQSVAPVSIPPNNSTTDNKENSPKEQSKWWPPPAPWDIYWPTIILGGLAAYIALSTLADIRRQTKNTETAAEAALKNAQAVIDAERAWIMVDLEAVPGFAGATVDVWQDGEPTHCVARFRLRYVNEGKSIAWVEEIWALFQIVKSFPPKPDTSILELLTVDLEWVGSKGSRYFDSTLEADGQESMELRSIIWGVVKYRDAFGEHQTVFGFRIKPDGSFRRLPSQYRAYNQNT